MEVNPGNLKVVLLYFCSGCAILLLRGGFYNCQAQPKPQLSWAEWLYFQYQPSGEGGARLPPATPHCLQNPKLPQGGPKIADGSGKVPIHRFLGAQANFRKIRF